MGDAQRDGAPLRRLHPDDIPDIEPREEPRARYGNHSPYEVWGKRYHVMPSSAGYVARGTGSWYGTKFHGRATSSQEPYDLYALTAAHKSLPLPTYVRVTNLNNGRSTIVKVNDRGPFKDDRVIDLSYAAAVKLGYADQGTAPVLVEAIDPRTYARNGSKRTPASAPVRQTVARAPAPVPGTGQQHFIQAGAFSSRDAAEQLRRRLADTVSQDVLISETRHPDRTLYRVRIGPLSGEQDARLLLSQVSGLLDGSPRVVVE